MIEYIRILEVVLVILQVGLGVGGGPGVCEEAATPPALTGVTAAASTARALPPGTARGIAATGIKPTPIPDIDFGGGGANCCRISFAKASDVALTA